MILRGSWRIGVIMLVVASALLSALWLPPVAQDLAYHRFADNRTLFGIANFYNVASNLLFVLIAVFGIKRMSALQLTSYRTAYFVFCIGLIGVGLGSAYYHYAPSATTLVWDRLPIVVVIMAVLSIVITARIDRRAGRLLLWPLSVAGIGSVLYWYWTEQSGQGDLRAYALAQFLPVVLMPLILLLYAGKNPRAGWLWATLASYAAAKVAEHFDTALYHALGFVSGHTLKHVLAALATLTVILAMSGQCGVGSQSK